jgi:ribonucleotide monophosphatase NagD (HAD superfamily)
MVGDAVVADISGGLAGGFRRAAVAAGLSCRPMAATVADTWSWLQDSGGELDDERAGEIGMSRERERQILASIA